VSAPDVNMTSSGFGANCKCDPSLSCRGGSWNFFPLSKNQHVSHFSFLAAELANNHKWNGRFNILGICISSFLLLFGLVSYRAQTNPKTP
jgi:hypothetical protein